MKKTIKVGGLDSFGVSPDHPDHIQGRFRERLYGLVD